MSGPALPRALRIELAARARHRCEYCLLHADFALLPHESDHIIATQHSGATVSENLAFACFACNRLKGPNIASVDPDTCQVLQLFHPRRDVWAGHFRLDGARIIPLTATGQIGRAHV